MVRIPPTKPVTPQEILERPPVSEEAIQESVGVVNMILTTRDSLLALKAGESVAIYDASGSVTWEQCQDDVIERFREAGWVITKSAGKYYFSLPQE